MDAHICQSCGHLWSEHTMYSDTNHCRSPGCVCERSQLNAEKHNHIDLRTRIETLETQLAAEREAVRVLGEYAYWNDTDDAAKHLTSGSKLDAVNKRIEAARRAVFNNPLARAEVEKASKV